MTATAQKFLSRASGAGLQEVQASISGGAGYEGKIPALDPTTGLLASSMMPTGIGADTINVATSEALTAGQFVNLWNNTGTAAARKADNTDTTKPAHGFVLAGAAFPGTATVYLMGLNNVVPLGGFTVADMGVAVYLSSSGGITKTRPTASTSLDQQLGYIVAVGATVSVNFDQVMGIAVV